MKIAVIGAGAFGSWTAFLLQKAGHHVTLIDRHGPGNPWNWHHAVFEGIFIDKNGTCYGCGDPRKNSYAEGF
jgi:2-polyprenyl-6-methoxyphenol hydroxylase-like FAD-dependent oxidoreductase